MNVTIANLTFTYASSRKLFDSLCITLTGPGLYFLTGKNGTGKSTLAQVMAGIVSPTAQLTGMIRFDSTAYDLAMPTTRTLLYEHVAYVHQKIDDMLAPHYTARENLAAAALSKYPGLALFKPQHTLPFEIPMDIPVECLSGGQRQLLAIAMALHKKPRILILDEPTSALDETHASQVMDMIEKIGCDIICICICHDEQLMQRYNQHQRIHLM